MHMLKAFVGALVAGLSALAVGLADDNITGEEWLTAGVATLTALGVVWAVPNKPAGVGPRNWAEGEGGNV